MEIKFIVQCPHCGKQQVQEKEQSGGEAHCEECEKSFWIAVTGGEIVHTHETKESADAFVKFAGQNPDVFSSIDCPYCGKKLQPRNYFRELGRVLDNNCMRVVYLTVGFNNKVTVHQYKSSVKTIFDPDFNATVEAGS